MMAGFEIRIDATGIDEAAQQLDPQRVYVILTRMFQEIPEYIAGELRRRAKPLVAKKIHIKKDPMRPPHWALVGSTHPVAHLLEGGTGALGGAGFNHAGQHRPPVAGIMRSMGLPKPQAFLVARAIGLRGGNPPQPFVAPTEQAVQDRAQQMAQQIANEETK